MRNRRHLKWMKALGVTIATLALAAAGGAGALALFALSLPPLDLAAALADRSPIVVDRDGRLLRPFLTGDGRWKLPVSHRDVDPRYLAMLKAYEDRRFDDHRGVDPVALVRAAGQWMANGRIVSGGSTLTMQVARLLEPREERSLAAKARQVARALALETRLSKSDILDLYLALAPFGGNLEGVRAASLAYFGKEPQRLSTAEAALLVALPQSPETRRPDRAPDAARLARHRVLTRAEAAGLVTVDERRLAADQPIPVTRLAFPNLAPHLAERSRRTEPQRTVIRLTVDGRVQQALEQLARERVTGQPEAVSVAILAVDNATGEIRASVGGVDYFDERRAGSIDLTQALRSPGSALKPFIYALAFENGIAHPETMLEDRPVRFGLYAPENFDLAYQGMVSARRSLQMSLNVPAVDLLSALGPQRFLARLKEAGVRMALPREGTAGGEQGPGAPGLAVGLGGLGVTLQDLTRLYAGLARGGELVSFVHDLSAMRRVETLRLVEPVAAWYVTDTLVGAPPPTNGLPGRIAYKTGTSYGYRDAWAVGYDRRHTIGVWVGRADNGAVPGLIGRQVAAPILFDAFARIGMDPTPPARPPGAIVATTGQLPPPLRHVRQDVAKTLQALAQPGLRLAFPPDGARIDIGDGTADPVGLKVTGGAPPFMWLINGAPIGAATARRESTWTARERGFVTISVVDARGDSDSVAVRLQ